MANNCAGYGLNCGQHDDEDMAQFMKVSNEFKSKVIIGKPPLTVKKWHYGKHGEYRIENYLDNWAMHYGVYWKSNIIYVSKF